MNKPSRYVALALAAAYLAGCSSGRSSSSNNGEGGSNGDASTLQIIAPKVIYSKTAGVSSGYITVVNPTAAAVKNLHYNLVEPIGGGNDATVDKDSAASCSEIGAHQQCNLKLNVAAGAVAGSLGFNLDNDSSTLAKLFKSNQSAASVTLPVGIEQAYFNSVAGADGITVSYYHTVIAGVPYILVSGIVASDKAGSFNNVALVDGHGNPLPNQQLISGNVNSSQGSTFSILLPVSASSDISQTFKVQTQQVVNGKVTPVSIATAANTLTTTSGVGITEMLPGAVYLTKDHPEQTITLVNSGDTTAQLQSLIASNPNIEVVFSSTNLPSGRTSTATLRLKNPALPASSGAVTLNYNNGKEEVKTSAVTEQNVSPQPNPNPSPSPNPTNSPNPPGPTTSPSPTPPTAGLTAQFSPDNNFYTTTTIGTVSRQLTLTNTGNTIESNLVLTLPTNFTIGTGTSNSCTVVQSTSPASISDNLAASGGSCDLTINYNNNTATSQNSSNISIAYDYNGGTAATPVNAGVNYEVTLSPANLAITPNSLTFGNVYNNNADESTDTVTITNSGDADATNLAFSFSGSYSNLFSIVAGGTCTSGGSLASGDNCTLNIQFGPLTVSAGSKTAMLDVGYDYAGGTTTTATSDLSGQVVAAQSADISSANAATTGFAGGTGADAPNAYQVEQNAGYPTISYTITNSGAVPATDFYIDGTATGWTMSGNCGTSTSGSKITLAATNGSCTLTMILISTATTGAQNLNLGDLTMHWSDQANPSEQIQQLSGTSYVNVYAPPTIAVTTSPASNISILSGSGSFTINATLNGGYNVANQTIHPTLTTGITGAVTLAGSVGTDCTVSSQSPTCTITVTAANGAAAATGDVVTVANATTPSMAATPGTVSFNITPPPLLVISLLLESSGIESNGTNYAYINRSGTAAVTVNLVSTDPTKMTVGSSSVSFALNDTNPIPVLLKGVTTGAATLRATASGYTESTMAYTITAPGAFSCVADLIGATNATKLCGCLNQNDGSGLMWYGSALTGSNAGYPFAYEATILAAFNSGSGHCGHTDWRIPSLGTINGYGGYLFCNANINQTTDFGKLGCYAITKGYASGSNLAVWLNNQGFSSLLYSKAYWSSSSDALNNNNGWNVTLDDGAVHTTINSTLMFLLPVRTEP